MLSAPVRAADLECSCLKFTCCDPEFQGKIVKHTSDVMHFDAVSVDAVIGVSRSANQRNLAFLNRPIAFGRHERCGKLHANDVGTGNAVNL